MSGELHGGDQGRRDEGAVISRIGSAMNVESNRLHGKRVAFTGRLATMARAEAQALVRTLGGFPASSVTRRTSILVVGQEGWPVERNGQLTRKLMRAKKL